jgi:thiamine-phosphate pyrophosphorylase
MLFFTDPTRTPSPERTMARLPRGAGVVFRAFGRPEALSQGMALRRLARDRGLTFLVGGDARLARALRADGLHLPERGVPARVDHGPWPRGFLITAAAHSLPAVRRAARAGVNAVVVSAVFPSASPSAKRPIGPMTLAAWTRAAGCPVYALGGVDQRTAKRLMLTGAKGFAAIDGFTGSGACSYSTVIPHGVERSATEMRDPAARSPERPDRVPHLHSAPLRFVRDDGER